MIGDVVLAVLLVGAVALVGGIWCWLDDRARDRRYQRPVEMQLFQLELEGRYDALRLGLELRREFESIDRFARLDRPDR